MARGWLRGCQQAASRKQPLQQRRPPTTGLSHLTATSAARLAGLREARASAAANSVWLEAQGQPAAAVLSSQRIAGWAETPHRLTACFSRAPHALRLTSAWSDSCCGAPLAIRSRYARAVCRQACSEEQREAGLLSQQAAGPGPGPGPEFRPGCAAQRLAAALPSACRRLQTPPPASTASTCSAHS